MRPQTRLGGFAGNPGVWWRYDLSVDEQQRSSEQTTCASHNKLSINLLELLAMVVTAYVMVVVKEDRPSVAGEPVLMRRDSSSAVTWVNRCGGTRDPRAVFIMGWLGVLEVNMGWCFESSHIPGSSNVLADGITRWDRADSPQKLTELSPTRYFRYPLAGGKFGGEWWESVFGDLAAILSSVGIAPSTYCLLYTSPSPRD